MIYLLTVFNLLVVFQLSFTTSDLKSFNSCKCVPSLLVVNFRSLALLLLRGFESKVKF